jgi:TPR repeat protein
MYTQAVLSQDSIKERYLLAENLLRGMNAFRKDTQKAFQLFLEIANRTGHVGAQYNVAMCFEYGIGVNKNQQNAFKYYFLSAQNGLVKSQSKVGFCFLFGIGTEKNNNKAHAYLKKAAEADDIDAQCGVGLCLLKGIGARMDVDNGFKWILAAAQNKNAFAQYHLGKCFEKGIGVELDAEQAFQWYLQAANKNVPPAEDRLGICYLKGIGTEMNERKAYQWLEKAANQGDISAQYHLGRCLQQGIGTQENKKEGFAWIKKSADQGNHRALYNVASCFFHGTGAEIDKGKSIEWLQKAAQAGNKKALYRLGTLCADGELVKKDEEKAFAYFKESENYGERNAIYRLGQCYLNGIGVDVNHKKAFDCFEKGAKSEEEYSQFYLGACYFKGIGTDVDYEKAFEWYQEADINGHPFAKHFFNKQLSFSIDFILEKAKKSTDCFIRCDFNKSFGQRDSYCGSAAFAAGINYAQYLSYPLFASQYEKKSAGLDVSQTGDIVLAQLTRYTGSLGPQYSVHSFQVLAKHFGIQNSQAIVLDETISENDYTQRLKWELRTSLLILPVDCVYEMPECDEGNSTHHVLATGHFHDDEDDTDYVIVVHHDHFGLWPISKLYQSNRQLPKNDPNDKNISLTEFRFGFFKIPVPERENVIAKGIAAVDITALKKN